MWRSRRGRFWIELTADDRIELRLEADGTPLRLAHPAAAGAGMGPAFGRAARRPGRPAWHRLRSGRAPDPASGADRRYTGPDCPPEMLADGGIPQGDCAPVPWCNSRRGYGAWIRTDANGTQFDLSGSRIALFTRAAAGPLRRGWCGTCATTAYTVLRCTPWSNLDSSRGQIPPQAESERLHHEPASNYAEGAERGHFVGAPSGEPYVHEWWMGTGSPIDFSNPKAERWWREQVKRILRLGVEGIKVDDGDGFYIGDEAVLADGRSGQQSAAGRSCWLSGSRGGSKPRSGRRRPGPKGF